MSLDQATFRAVLGRFASGVTIVTARDASGLDHGMTASAFCSLSLEPPLVLVCVERIATVHPVLMAAREFVVNILAAGQEAVSRRFAERIDDRFTGIGFRRGVTGAAILHEALAHVECEMRDRHAGGDHTVFVGEVIAAEAREDGPLLYYRGGYAGLER
ncbi:MAG: flavin reductase family protein [Gemmatimonadota bacterium]|nr:flavin reductase family protein [Gemmatimonadota bacterium]